MKTKTGRIRKTGMKVEISPLRWGGYTARPVGQVWVKKFGEYMADWLNSDPSVPTLELEECASVLWQHDGELPETVTENRAAMRELGRGWPVVVLVDPWEFGHWLGWDAHTVA